MIFFILNFTSFLKDRFHDNCVHACEHPCSWAENNLHPDFDLSFSVSAAVLSNLTVISG